MLNKNDGMKEVKSNVVNAYDFSLVGISESGRNYFDFSSLHRLARTNKLEVGMKVLVPVQNGCWWEQGGKDKSKGREYASLICNKDGEMKSKRETSFEIIPNRKTASAIVYKGDHISYMFSQIGVWAGKPQLEGFTCIFRVDYVNSVENTILLKIIFFNRGLLFDKRLEEKVPKFLQKLFLASIEKMKTINCVETLFMNNWGYVPQWQTNHITFSTDSENTLYFQNLKEIENEIKKESAKDLKIKDQIFVIDPVEKTVAVKFSTDSFTTGILRPIKKVFTPITINTTSSYGIRMKNDEEVAALSNENKEIIFGAETLEDLIKIIEIGCKADLNSPSKFHIVRTVSV
jgi:hypothetical protein